MKDTYVNSCGEVIGTVEVVNDTRVSDEVRFFVEQHVTISENPRCILINEGRYATAGPCIGIPIEAGWNVPAMRAQLVNAIAVLVQRGIVQSGG